MHICMLPVIMVRRKTDDVVEGIVMGLLKQNMSYRKIVKTVKEMGYSISVASIHRIKHCKGIYRNLPLKPGESGLFRNVAQRQLLTSLEKSTG